MLGVSKLGSVCHIDPKLPFFNFLILKLASGPRGHTGSRLETAAGAFY
jgi:hypothetical protein